MRRTSKKNRDVRVELGPPRLTAEHLRLYARYHAAQHEHRGWVARAANPNDYFQSFVDGAEEYGHELRFLVDNTLVAVALIDLLPSAISAVYCYYDPAQRDRALGIYSVLQHMALARERGAKHVYLGYWIEANASMRYKARYHPHSVIDGRPEDDETPIWQAPEAPLPETPS